MNARFIGASAGLCHFTLANPVLGWNGGTTRPGGFCGHRLVGVSVLALVPLLVPLPHSPTTGAGHARAGERLNP
jgi:hypothetical protein